jgi:hypothetical protein
VSFSFFITESCPHHFQHKPSKEPSDNRPQVPTSIRTNSLTLSNYHLCPGGDISKPTSRDMLTQRQHLEAHLLEPNANLSELESNVNTSNTGIRIRLAILVQRQCLEPNANILNPMPTCRPCLSPWESRPQGIYL